MSGRPLRTDSDAARDAVLYSIRRRVAVVFLCLDCFGQLASAQVTWSGDLDPADPTTWDAYTHGYIGKTGNGTLSIMGGGEVQSGTITLGYESGALGIVTIDGVESEWNTYQLEIGDSGSGTLSITDGGVVRSRSSTIGHESGSSGIVTVNGTGSRWIDKHLSGDLYVGEFGSGTLNIVNGGEVDLRGNTFVSRHAGSSGTIHFDTGMLTTRGLFASPADLSGMGLINTRGLVSDIDLVFDATHGLKQVLSISDNPGQDITLNLNSGYAAMGAGVSGTGTMRVSDGIVLRSEGGYIGYKSGSSGVVTVEGTGSTWESGYELCIGDEGSGTLNITGGGAVTARATYLSRHAGSSGMIYFDGGTLTTDSFFGVFGGLSGTGMIDTHGLVSDIDLVFDATHGLDQTFHVTNNPGQDVTINLGVDGAGSLGAGFSGTGTMRVSDGVAVNSINGFIGYKPGSSGGVTVEGVGATWTNSDELHVGDRGNGTLSITDGGAVQSGSIHGNDTIGNRTGSTSEVTVDGVGSTWTSRGDLFVGHEGSGTLNITGGGVVSNRGGTIGHKPGSSGMVTVDGAGSTWTSSRNIDVGFEGTGTLNVTTGGVVQTGNAYRNDTIGDHTGMSGIVTVDGAGSTWISGGSLSVGLAGILNITDGGVVTVGQNVHVVRDAGSSGAIHFDGGTLRTSGLFSVFADLHGSGTLDTHGLVSDVDLIFNATHGLNQTFRITNNPGQDITINLDVDGAGSLGAGFSGTGTMRVLDGMVVESRDGYIGYQSGSSGVVTVEGSGSMWTNSSDLFIGHEGGGTLSVTDGGVVSNGRGYIGRYSGSSGTVTVHGAGSTWTNSDSLSVGFEGSGTLSITGGGVVQSGRLYNVIGNQTGSSGVVTVDGAGSTWTSSGALRVGIGGSLNITGGGVVNVERDTLVSRTGTIHLDTGTLTTGGFLGVFDSLSGTGVINTHGLVSDLDLVFDATHGMNRVFHLNDNPGQDITLNLTIDGNGAMGAGFSSFGTMRISDGIVLNSSNGTIGSEPGSSGVVSVEGAGSTWNSRSGVDVGVHGNGTLDITRGGTVSCDYSSVIGSQSDSSGAVTVAGSGSTWISGSLEVGHLGRGTLSITDGGSVSFGFVKIGYLPWASGVVTVDGVGSTWISSQYLDIGWQGNGTLRITNGGTVDSVKNSNIAYQDGSSGVVIVDGVGSTWDHSDSMRVGFKGNGALHISGGGVVRSTRGNVGGYSSGSLGVVTVDGVGSAWTIDDPSGAGRYGGELTIYRGTLAITGGGAVSCREAFVMDGYGLANAVTVDGVGSTWTVSDSLDIHSNATLSITEGGEVRVEAEIRAYGAIHFDNGTLTTGGLQFAADNLSGTGTISTHGLIGDVDLVFNATHGLNQTLHINENPGQDIIVILDVDGAHEMGAGFRGVGTMRIADGITLKSSKGIIGHSEGSSGVVTVEGANSSWTSGNLDVGASGNGTLHITSGGVVNSYWSTIGSYSGSSGVVTVDGIGSTWASSGKIYVGRSGTGTLNVTDGGAVSSMAGEIGTYAYSPGMVTVDGAGSKWTNGGDLTIKNGTLNITSGGEVTVGAATWVSRDPDLSGTIHFDEGTMTTGGLGCDFDDLSGVGVINTHGLVSDVNLVFDATHGLSRSLQVQDHPDQDITIHLDVNGMGVMGAGFNGAGTMRISDGIVVGSMDGTIGYQPGSIGQVSVVGGGSAWNARGYLDVGRSGSGMLGITQGGSVINGRGFIGRDANAAGVVTVDGAGSTWTNYAHLNVGYFGSGTLSITQGAAVSSRGGAIGKESGSMGVVTVNGVGSAWASGDSLDVGRVGSGTLNISRGGTVSNGASVIGRYSNATGVVAVDGAGSTWTVGDDLFIGHQGKGALEITDGGMVHVAGILTIDRYVNGESFINMATGGMLALSGQADDSLADFFELIEGTDAIRYWDDSLADWSDIDNATFGVDYTLSYLTEGELDGYTLFTVGTLPPDADFDGSGTVDGDDLTAWQSGFGTLTDATHAQGDTDGDGDVDGNDFLAWQQQFGGASGGVETGTAPVPEPTAVVLLALAIGMVRLLNGAILFRESHEYERCVRNVTE